MAARGKARKRAVDVLYEAELRGVGLRTTLADRIAAADPPVPAYTVTLVEGVQANLEQLDELIGSNATGWSLERMSFVDRNILRVGAYELLWMDDVPDPVAISEAVRLATDLSGDESPSFVNGLLGTLLDLKPTLPTHQP